MEKEKLLFAAGESTNLGTHYKNQYGSFLRKTQDRTIIWPCHTTLGNILRGSCTQPQRYLQIIFIPAFFFNYSWEMNQPGCPSTEVWMKKHTDTYTWRKREGGGERERICEDSIIYQKTRAKLEKAICRSNHSHLAPWFRKGNEQRAWTDQCWKGLFLIHIKRCPISFILLKKRGNSNYLRLSMCY